jgi:hypothetical protein
MGVRYEWRERGDRIAPKTLLAADRKLAAIMSAGKRSPLI